MTVTSTLSHGQLYMRLAQTNICFARYEADDASSFCFEPYRLKPQVSLIANLREARRAAAILQNQHSESLKILVNAPATLVPLTEFQEEDCVAIYNHCFPSSVKRQVFYDVVAPANSVVIFALEDAACRAFEDLYSKVYYVSSLTPLLHHFASKGMTQVLQKRVCVHCHEMLTDVMVFEGTRLLAVNTFETPEVADAVYYTLNMASQLGVNLGPPSDDNLPVFRQSDYAPFYVAGTPELRDAIADEMRRYAVNVLTMKPSAEFNRNIVATTPEVPYDLVTFLLDCQTF
ncbi:hypothetical protein IMSAGC014_01543 [Bacteroidaceae bacterium]|uniref:DUF3822 family protein n=1 Tax=Prevotella sp. MGM2 TaxID=2033406 RepID=UPI000CE9EE28|nr:DUF3822 family protein [Prevotella sp. MGM2]GAY30247.1 hypothetical protein PvtlMGM2_1100 [Prevotella sp. MGM2]GFI35033.1 hypothetical protein IMSAGC014_01543 [Bacteroidaceae bacterium]